MRVLVRLVPLLLASVAAPALAQPVDTFVEGHVFNRKTGCRGASLPPSEAYAAAFYDPFPTVEHYEPVRRLMANESNCPTTPSVEFSIGTTPKETRPCLTS